MYIYIYTYYTNIFSSDSKETFIYIHTHTHTHTHNRISLTNVGSFVISNSYRGWTGDSGFNDWQLNFKKLFFSEFQT